MYLKDLVKLQLLALLLYSVGVVHGNYHDARELKAAIKYYAYTRRNPDKPVSFKLSTDSIARSGLNLLKETT